VAPRAVLSFLVFLLFFMLVRYYTARPVRSRQRVRSKLSFKQQIDFYVSVPQRMPSLRCSSIYVNPYNTLLLLTDVDRGHSQSQWRLTLLHYLKKRLDTFWANQNVMFDWTADITGTGDRSE